MSSAALLRRARGSTVVHNTLALYAVQAASFLMPLVTLPYLARVLQPEGWGLVVLGQSFTAWSALVMQFGFSFSATRMVAQSRHDADRVAEIVAGVQGAKLTLLAAIVAGGVGAGLLVPVFRAHPAYLVFACIAAALHGFTPLWYFQGMERMRGAALLDVGARMVAAAGIFVLVHEPAHGWRVLALQALAALLPVSVTTIWMYREVPMRLCRPREAAAVLRNTWPLFVFVGAASLYGTANSLLLGVLALPTAVAFYGAADRLVRAGLALITPLSQAMYPWISHRVAQNRAHADEVVRRSLLPVGGLGLVMGAALALAAPLLIRVIMGPGYEAAVQVLRILALLPPLIALGTVLGIHWALPLGMDRVYIRLVLAAGACNLVLATLLVPRFGAVGMAGSAVLAEALVELGLVVLFVRHVRRGEFAEMTQVVSGD